MFKAFQILLEQEIHTYTPHPPPPAPFPPTKKETTTTKDPTTVSFSYLRFWGYWSIINTRYEATVLGSKKSVQVSEI